MERRLGWLVGRADAREADGGEEREHGVTSGSSKQGGKKGVSSNGSYVPAPVKLTLPGARAVPHILTVLQRKRAGQRETDSRQTVLWATPGQVLEPRQEPGTQDWGRQPICKRERGDQEELAGQRGSEKNWGGSRGPG